jgi:hypothetical protein
VTIQLLYMGLSPLTLAPAPAGVRRAFDEWACAATPAAGPPDDAALWWEVRPLP